MNFAKEQNRQYRRPALLAAGLLSLCLSLLPMGASAKDEASFRITQVEAENHIAEALEAAGLGENIQATILGRRSDDLIRRDFPVVLEIAELTPDASAGRFTASLVFHSEAALDAPSERLGAMENAGRFDQMQAVPVLKLRTTSGTVITEEDITWQKLPGARLARETILDVDSIIGMTPVRALGANRPIREHELQVPPVVTRQSTVYMNYKSANLSIQAVGLALQDGALGDRIRVRNTSSGNTLEAIVTAPGQVQVIPAPSAVQMAVIPETLPVN